MCVHPLYVFLAHVGNVLVGKSDRPGCVLSGLNGFFVSIFILPIFICACKVKVPASNNTHMNSFLIVVMNFNV